MMQKKFHIMGLCCLAESQLPFRLVDTFDAFLCTEGEPDLIFELRQAESVDLNGFQLKTYYEGDLCYWIYEKDGQWLKLCHHVGNQSVLRWGVLHRDEDPKRYIYYIFEDYLPYLQTFDPFLFLGLPKFFADHGALLLHSSVIRCEGKGVLFTAPSGTGKSTQADLWVKYHGAEILNGDRGLIRKEQDGFWVYGSPYAGSSYIYKDERAPVRAIVVLRQAPVNRIRKMGLKEMFLNLLSQFLLFREDSQVVDSQMDAITELMNQVPVYLLECRPDQEATDILYDYMKEKD